MHEQVHCPDEAASHQLPKAVASWIICIVSVGECSSLMQNLMQITCSATQSLWMWQPYSIHAHSMVSTTPHWLVQWGHHCSGMCIPVHSPWLPADIYVMQTILIILTMTALFLDRPHIWIYIFIYIHIWGLCGKSIYTYIYRNIYILIY